MNRAAWKVVVPAIVLAVGILVSTQAAAMSMSSGSQITPGLLAMAGPLVMAIALVTSLYLAGRLHGRPNLLASFVLGGALLMASAMIAIKEPTNVASMLPILGAGLGFSVIAPNRRGEGSRCPRILRS